MRQDARALALQAVKWSAASADWLVPPPRGVVLLQYHRVGRRAPVEVDLTRDLFEEQMALVAGERRATTLDRNDGVTKLILEPSTTRILGVGIAGSGAGEIIAEGVLAVEMAALASDLALSIHPHPTLSETLMEAAEVFFGQSTHVYRPQRRRSDEPRVGLASLDGLEESG